MRKITRQARMLVMGLLVLPAWAGCGHLPPPSPLPAASPPPADNAFWHQAGGNIVDGQGRVVRIRGVNLGGWLHWEGWIWGEGFLSESDLLHRLRDLVGTEETENFRRQVYARFITEKDLAAVAALGFNVVRVPINHRLLETDERPYAYLPEGWAVLDRLLAWAQTDGLGVILDLHSAPGGQGKLFTADPDPGRRLWDSSENQERTVALWRAIAARYRDHPALVGYDLLNEPEPPGSATLLNFYRRLLAAVRENDRRHLVLLEGAKFATDFSFYQPGLDYNLACEFHLYTWFGDNRIAQLAKYTGWSRQEVVPFVNGEFGENRYAMIQSTRELFADPAYGLAGWCFWPWKKAPNRFPGLMVIHPSARWKKVLHWLNRPHWPTPRPTRAEALQGLGEFLQAVAYEQASLDEKMAGSLGLKK